MIHEKVLQLVRMRGPVIPSQISHEIGTNILMASAILSEMVAKNALKISNVKIGSSPLYYLPGQETRLQEYSSRLHEKEKAAYDLIKEKKVLRDRELPAVTRVALRSIKDFSKPLEVTAGDSKELFWKWYLLPTEEAEKEIRNMLTKPEPMEPAKLEIKKEVEEEKQAEKEIAPLQRQTILRTRKPKPAAEDAFSKKVKEFFEKNRIEIIEEEVIKKRTETDFIIRIPSVVGSLKYYCKARNKKRCSDADLSAAYVQGQSRKLPVIFLASGDLTKKAKEMFNKEFSHITFKKI